MLNIIYFWSIHEFSKRFDAYNYQKNGIKKCQLCENIYKLSLIF